MQDPVAPEFDRESYLFWESRRRERYELHHGFVVASAGGTLDHDRIAMNTFVALDRLCPAPCRAFGSNVKVAADARNFYYPDAGVVCEDHGGDTVEIASLRVVVEVLSPSTRAYDLIDKRAVYRRIASLEAYVVVRTALRRCGGAPTRRSLRAHVARRYRRRMTEAACPSS